MAYGFKRFVLVSLGIMLLGAALVYGLKAGLPSESQTEEPIIVERVFDEWGLKLTMSVGKTVYAFEEPVNVTLTLTNIGNETVTYYVGSYGYKFDFLIYNSSDYHNVSSHVDSWSVHWLFPAFGGIITLNPDDSISTMLQWPSQWHLHPKRTPGTYYIFGITSEMHDIKRGSQRADYLLLYLEELIEVTILSL